ncbi:DUF542 domain-containing protein [Peptoniphilus sp.]|jgi:regulator of cell morphogenesis and NO signaling|uniref:DUF542 domain-containing protein n=1 Tax=Peptoniphilus sp. TaxID=1971214 RepID=UPI003D8D18BD
MITLNTKIEDIVKIDDRLINFFNDKRIDYCCNGYMSVEEVAKEKNIDAAKLINSIEDELNSLKTTEKVDEDISLDDFKNLSVEEMIESIIKNHHEKEAEMLFYIDKLLNKILKVHFEHHGEELLELHKLFGALKTELEEHFVKEEKITFPLMLENPNPSPEIKEKIHELETDHEKAGDIIKKMIDLTDGFTPPEDGCKTYEKTFKELDALTKDIFVHIFKENSILFLKYNK